MKLHLPLSLLTFLFTAFTMQVNGSVVTDFSWLKTSTGVEQILTLDGDAKLSFKISKGNTWDQGVNHSPWGNLNALNEMNEVLGTSFTTVGLTEYKPYCSGQGGSNVTLALSNSGIEAGKTAVFYALVTKIGDDFDSTDDVTVSGLDSCTIEFAGIGGEGWGDGPSANANEYSLVKITGTVNSNEDPISITGKGKLAFGMLTYQEYGGRYYWEGGNGTWSNQSTYTNWSATDGATEGLEAYSSYSIAHFTGTNSEITVSDNVYAAGMKVSGASYTFSINETAKLSTGNIEIAEGASMSVGGAGSLELRGVIKNNGTLTLAGNIYLTDHDHKSRVYSEGNNGYLAQNAYNLIIGAENVSNSATIWSNETNVTLTEHHGNLYYVVDGGPIAYDESKYYVQEGTVQQSSLSEVGSGVVIVVHNDGQTMTGKLELNSDFANTITGTGGVIINTDGTMTLSGANTYTGGTTVSGGTLKIGSDCDKCNAYTGGVLVENGAKLDLYGKEGLYQSVVTLAGGATLLNSNSGLADYKRQMKGLTLTGAAEADIANSMGLIAGNYDPTTLNLGGNTLTKKGDGIFYMVNTSGTDAGLIDVQAGGIQIGTYSSGNKNTDIRNVVFNLASSTNVSLVNGADLTAKAITGSGGVSGEANTVLTLTSAEDHSYSGVISGAIALKKEGSGTLTLSGNNTYTGGTTINGGTVIVNPGSTLGKGNVTINNATVEATHTSSSGSSVMGNANATVTINGGGALTLKGHDMLGYGGSRLGNLKLAGTADALAQLIIGDTGSMTLQTNVTMEGNSRLSGNKLNTYDTSFTVTGKNNLIDITTFELREDWNVTVDSGGELEISSALTNSVHRSGKLIKKGSGMLLISGTANNSFTAGVTIDGGVLKLGKSSALGSGAVTVNDGGTLDMNGTAEVENAVTLKEGATLTNTKSEIVNGKKQLPNVTLEGDATVTGSENFAMVASGHGQAYLNLNRHTLTKEGSNTFTLSNTAVSAGTLKVLRGTLNALSRANNLGGSLDISEATVEVGRVNAGDEGTFQLSGNSEAIKALNFDGGKVTVDSGHKLTVSGATTVTSNGGTMQGAVQLNSLSVDGALKIGDGSTKGVIISNLNSQTGTLGGTITSDAANTTISLAGAGGDNKAIISNALIDIMAGSTFNLSNAVVADTSRITDDAATLSVSNVQMNVTVGTNATAEASTLPDGGVTLQKMGGSETVNESEGTKVLAITSSLMDTVTVSGSDEGSELTINLNGLKDFDLTSYGYVTLSFTSAGKTAASFSTTDLGVNIAYAGSILSAPVYFDTTEGSNGNNVTTLYVEVTSDFIAAVPEPTTTTLSLLALAGLAARRRRK